VKRCGKCREPYRTGRMAYVTTGGKVKRLRVCPKCAKVGVLVVAAEQAASCNCGKPAKFCGACATDAAHKDKAADVSGALAQLRAWVALTKTVESEFSHGRADGLSSAIGLLESGRF